MRPLLLFLILLPVSAAAQQPSPIMGLPLADLISCAGIPAAQMQIGNQTFLQYAEESETGGMQKFGDIAVFQKRANSCEATVTISEGVVTDVKFKKRGGLLVRQILCSRLFKECRH